VADWPAGRPAARTDGAESRANEVVPARSGDYFFLVALAVGEVLGEVLSVAESDGTGSSDASLVGTALGAGRHNGPFTG